MTDILRTLLFLNVQGSVLIVLLLILKGVIRKSFSGFWQRNLWVLAMVFMLLPVWKLIPAESVEPIIIPLDNVLTTEYEELLQNQWEDSDEKIESIDNDVEGTLPVQNSINSAKILLYIWITGCATFLLLSIGSYSVYLNKMKRESKRVDFNENFEIVKESLKIRRKIRVRETKLTEPPLLTGCFFPVIYMPETKIDDESERMIYLHELTHYKHKDLPIKWFASIINAINWFNPLLYFAMKNINEACEIYCDEAVTKNMDTEGKKAYMNTILNLVEKK